MRHESGFIAAVAASLVIGGCGSGGGESGSSSVREDSAGVEIVRSSAVDRPLTWTVRETLRLGGDEEGPGSFTRAGLFNTGADDSGNLYVMDSNASRVVVFAPDGSHLRTMGTAGEGPGELQFPIGMSVSPNGVATVFDIGKGSLVPFGPDGDALPQVPFPHFTEPGVRRHFQKTNDGIIVAKGVGRPMEERKLELRAWLDGQASPDTTVFMRLSFAVPDMVNFGCMQVAFQPLFTPMIRWAWSGDMVAAATGDDYRIDIYRRDGSLVRSIRREIAPMRASEELAVSEVGSGMQMSTGTTTCEATAQEVVDGRGFAATVPAIRTLLVADDGTLWVERWEAGSTEANRSGPIDVFDSTGAYSGTLPPGSSFPLLLLGPDRIAITDTDAFDVQRLVIQEVQR